MTTIFRKRGDTAVGIEDTLKLGTTPIDISGSTVLWVWKDMSTNAVTKHSASVDLSSTGSVQYAFTANDVAEVGSYLTEWEVIFGDGTIVTVPTDGFIKLRIVEDLG